MTCPNCDHPRVTLHDGTETCTWSEAWRHECEARHVLAMPTVEARRRYLWGYSNKQTGKWVRGIKDARGEAACRQLETTIRTLWSSKRERPAAGGE